MPVFKKENKGKITQLFNNPNKIYEGRGGVHSGVDYAVGHGRKVVSDNDGYVYKTFSKGELKSNWCGVYYIAETNDDDVCMEIVQGHFLSNDVEAGQHIKAGDTLGRQGNYGYVWGTYKGKFQQVPVEAQLSGEAGMAGSHVHESWRPVKLVDKVDKNKHYLKLNGGRYFKFKRKYCEIIDHDNGMKGFVDPMDYVYKPKKVVDILKQQIMMAMLKLQVQVVLAEKHKYEHELSTDKVA